MNAKHRPASAALALTFGSVLALTACGSGTDGSATPATPTASVAATSTAAAPTPSATAPSTPAPAATTGSSGSSGSKPGGESKPGGGSKPAATTVTTSYALLTDIWRTGSASYALSYDRVDYLTGAAAKAYYRKHPDQEPRDWAVSNTNPLLRQLPVNAKATFYGSQVLGPGNGSTLKQITAAQLVASASAHPRTLVKVSEKVVGNHREVTRVAEVYGP